MGVTEVVVESSDVLELSGSSGYFSALRTRCIAYIIVVLQAFHGADDVTLLSVCLLIASRGFSIAAPTVWNSLPSSIRSSTSADTFRRLLKTHCFQQAYCSP